LFPSLSFFSVEARFLPASRLWSFVPPGKSGGGCFPLASRGYGGLFLCWFFSSFLLSGSKAKSMVPSAGIWWHSCLLAVFLACFFSRVISIFLEPDLLNTVVFLKTCAAQPCSPSPSVPAAGSTCHVVLRLPARGLHAPERPLLFGAREGHATPFYGRARWGWGLRWWIYGWVQLVMARVSHAPPSPVDSVSVSSADCYVCLVFSALCCCVSSCCYVQSGCVLLKFY
jgi:hypothetical protein